MHQDVNADARDLCLKPKSDLNCSCIIQSTLYHCSFDVFHKSGLLIAVVILQVGREMEFVLLTLISFTLFSLLWNQLLGM